MKRTIQDDLAVVWGCDNCGSWWGSRGSLDEGNDALQSVVAERPELEWESYRGWMRSDDEFGDSCPECGEKTIQVLFTVDIPGQ
jgi:hypothetical protein